jgi:hypothetical protein
MSCNPLSGVGDGCGGGGNGIVGEHNVLTGGLFAESGTDGDRRLLHKGNVPVGIWRYSTSLGGVWVPDGLIDTAILGVDGATAFGAAIDGFPSTNGGAGSIALSWGANGAVITGNGSTNQKAWWEWELFSGDLDWGDIQSMDLEAHIVFSSAVVDAFCGMYMGEFQDNGANRNEVEFRYEFNDADVGVVFPNVGNTVNVGVDIGLDVLIDGSYAQSQSGVRGIAMVAESGAVPTELALATTTSGSNHEPGDTFSRMGFNASANAGAGAWTATLKRFIVTINEKG